MRRAGLADNPAVPLHPMIAAGTAALDAGRWRDAAVAFEAALSASETPEALDGLAQALYWEGDYTAAITHRERAFAAFRARGETRYPAVIAAYWLAFDYAAFLGNAAAASGWLERGKRLAAASGDCPERGWVELACALATDRLDEKQRHVTTAAAIAQRFDDADLECAALAYAGLCLVIGGRVAEGMRQLDEAAAAASAGEVRNLAVAGEIYCKVLLACEIALDVRRAEQWAAVAESLSRRSRVVWAAAICLMHYGGILTAAGRWYEAEQALTRSMRLYDESYRALRAGAAARLADLRVGQGRLAEADELLQGSDHDAYAVRPIARLHLARGQAEQAARSLERVIDGDWDGVTHARLLALLVEAQIAAGRIDEAQLAGARLADLAARMPTPQVRGFAGFAMGLLGSDDGRDTSGHFDTAIAEFAAAGLVVEQARARLQAARLFCAAKPNLAIAEARAAAAAFERMGATPSAKAAASLLRTLNGEAENAVGDLGMLTSREREVLSLIAVGLSNPEIGQRLGISRKTASHHVSGILMKLGLRNRVEAAAYTSRMVDLGQVADPAAKSGSGH
jgi:ATP/maltotriose-dependent transcriptional regulator MalT